MLFGILLPVKALCTSQCRQRRKACISLRPVPAWHFTSTLGKMLECLEDIPGRTLPERSMLRSVGKNFVWCIF